MTTRPLSNVFDPSTGESVAKVPFPAVLSAPIRLDIVEFVHSNINKNRRQAHGVQKKAGMKHSAESWGTGRAVARIPRVSGSGTHRSGQAAFGNMCRSGRMFAPLKTWRRWHRRVNIKQKRHAVAAALAASAVVPLVQGRGHQISNVAELPLVFDDKLENFEKTKQVVNFLKKIGAYEDVQKVIDCKKMKAGKGKLRGKRFHLKKGPLFIYSNENIKLIKAVRNIPGVEICNVNRLNLLQLAPGGQLGRFCIWTQSAYKSLNSVFGTYKHSADEKIGYQLNRPMLTNADISRIINSNAVQTHIKPAKPQVNTIHFRQHKNPLKNNSLLYKLNPNAKLVKETARKANEDGQKKRQEIINKKRGFLSKDQKKVVNKQKKDSKNWYRIFQGKIHAADEEARLDDIENLKTEAALRKVD